MAQVRMDFSEQFHYLLMMQIYYFLCITKKIMKFFENFQIAYNFISMPTLLISLVVTPGLYSGRRFANTLMPWK